MPPDLGGRGRFARRAHKSQSAKSKRPAGIGRGIVRPSFALAVPPRGARAGSPGKGGGSGSEKNADRRVGDHQSVSCEGRRAKATARARGGRGGAARGKGRRARGRGRRGSQEALPAAARGARTSAARAQAPGRAGGGGHSARSTKRGLFVRFCFEPAQPKKKKSAWVSQREGATTQAHTRGHRQPRSSQRLPHRDTAVLWPERGSRAQRRAGEPSAAAPNGRRA